MKESNYSKPMCLYDRSEEQSVWSMERERASQKCTPKQHNPAIEGAIYNKMLVQNKSLSTCAKAKRQKNICGGAKPVKDSEIEKSFYPVSGDGLVGADRIANYSL
uniref:Uncharacterized protein n=1 Tax=Schistocephalus solidus TaxID=70667 RepID=A0A0V0J611_SCHSO